MSLDQSENDSKIVTDLLNNEMWKLHTFSVLPTKIQCLFLDTFIIITNLGVTHWLGDNNYWEILICSNILSTYFSDNYQILVWNFYNNLYILIFLKSETVKL